MRCAGWIVVTLVLCRPALAHAQTTGNPHGNLPRDMECTACHSPSQWKPLRQDMSFDHARAAGFALTGRHAAVACAGCHGGLKFAQRKAKPRDCVSCHTDVHQARLGRDCAACHDTRAFTGKSSMQAHAGTTFPLAGAHAQVPCEGCHRDERAGRFTAVDAACVSCHQPDYQRGHPAGGVPTNCTSCHTSNQSWTGALFSHDAFPLVGAHRTAQCSVCHAGADHHLIVPKPASSSDCVSCHRGDYDRKHTGTNFPLACLNCHTEQKWTGATFVHDAFPLQGAHTSLTCSQCHAPGDNHLLFNKPAGSNDCVACHRADYDRKHTGSGYSTTCLNCHNINRWSGASFTHNAFPLVGTHSSLACTSCHAPGDNHLLFPKPTGTSDCVACHRADYDRQHTGTGYPTTCSTCHTSNTSWSGASVDHTSISSGYTLLGAHIRATCGSCHAPPDGQLRFNPPPTTNSDCIACHRTEYDAQHTGSGYPTVCLGCHSNDTWTGATFTHNLFPLVGAHTALPCTACHVPPNNALIYPKPASSSDCVACHQSDYDRQHIGSGFPTTCLSCHTTSTWLGAVFDHAAVANGFVLQGVHAQRPCSVCHAPDGTPLFKPSSHSDCYTCHTTDFSSAHGTLGYPTTCTMCHQPTAWTQTTFDHDAQYFPIFSGAHQARWQRCQDCHPTQADFKVFTCLTCHTKTVTDAHHTQVSGYSYDSARCYACHPRGKH